MKGNKYKKLIGRMVEKCGSRRDFANAMGMSYQSLSNKVREETFFTLDEVNRACKILDISATEIPEYFFANGVE